MSNQISISFSFCWTTAIVFVLVLIAQGQQQQPARGCGSCMTRQQKKEYDVQMFKEKILHKLRLPSPPMGPHVRRADLEKIPSIKSLMQDCETAQEALAAPRQDRPAPRQDRAAPRCPGRYCRHTPEHEPGMMMDQPVGRDDDKADDDDDARTLVNVFQVPDIEKSSGPIVLYSLEGYSSNVADLESAVLGVYVEDRRKIDSAHSRSDSTQYRSALVYVYRKVRENDWYGPTTREFLRKKRVTLRRGSGHWVHFNLTQLALTWIQQPFTNLGLELEAYDLIGHPLRLSSHNSSSQAGQKSHPYLQLQFRDPDHFGHASGGRLARSRRSEHSQAGNCNEMTPQSHCCRYSLVIDFKTIGWDNWIISPKRANVYFCNGDCPFLYHTAFLGPHLGRQVDRDGPLPGAACCSPTKFSNLRLLYITDNGTYAHSDLPQLIVEKCGCQ